MTHTISTIRCHWVQYVVGSRARLNVSMDWIEFDADGHAATMLALLTRLLKRRRLLSLALMEIYR